MHPAAFHLAVPVDDLDAAEHFYGSVLNLPRGRSAATWIDWNLGGHQLVTHEVGRRTVAAGLSGVDDHAVPVPHFGLVLPVDEFHAVAQALQDAGVEFVIDPYLRFAGQPGEQWTMFFHDPAGNALEFKAFADPHQLFATAHA